MLHPTAELLAYIENRLDPEMLAGVEAHLQACAACRAEALALRETQAALAALGRAIQRLPAHPARSWAVVRQQWQSPLAAQVRNVSRRLSWQVIGSLAVAIMLFMSGISLNPARAAVPSVPYIQTPGTQFVADESATFPATRPVYTLETPTQTRTPTLTPTLTQNVS